jgi:hypothetical protein
LAAGERTGQGASNGNILQKIALALSGLDVRGGIIFRGKTRR